MIDRTPARDALPISVPRAVLAGLEAVRVSGLTNMLDRPVVVRIAEEMGFEECARWIRENQGLYATGVFRGFQEIE